MSDENKTGPKPQYVLDWRGVEEIQEGLLGRNQELALQCPNCGQPFQLPACESCKQGDGLFKKFVPAMFFNAVQAGAYVGAPLVLGMIGGMMFGRNGLIVGIMFGLSVAHLVVRDVLSEKDQSKSRSDPLWSLAAAFQKKAQYDMAVYCYLQWLKKHDEFILPDDFVNFVWACRAAPHAKDSLRRSLFDVLFAKLCKQAIFDSKYRTASQATALAACTDASSGQLAIISAIKSGLVDGDGNSGGNAFDFLASFFTIVAPRLAAMLGDSKTSGPATPVDRIGEVKWVFKNSWPRCSEELVQELHSVPEKRVAYFVGTQAGQRVLLFTPEKAFAYDFAADGKLRSSFNEPLSHIHRICDAPSTNGDVWFFSKEKAYGFDRLAGISIAALLPKQIAMEKQSVPKNVWLIGAGLVLTIGAIFTNAAVNEGWIHAGSHVLWKQAKDWSLLGIVLGLVVAVIGLAGSENAFLSRFNRKRVDVLTDPAGRL